MAKPTKDEVTALIDVLTEAGFEPRRYSGRGMYGKECVSIQGDDISEWDVARALWFNNFDAEDLDIPAPLRDRLGLGIVLYWPSYEWPERKDDNG